MKTYTSRQKIAQLESCLQAILEQNKDGIIIVDQNYKVVYINKEAERLLNKNKNKCIGEIFGYPIDGKKKIELDIIHSPNTIYVVEMQAIEIIWHSEKASLISINDITELVKTNEMLEEARRKEHELAHTDPITGLPNRNKFFEILNYQINFSNRYEKEFALVFIDIDNFKHINDTLGHKTGDELIKKVGEYLHSCIRGCDTVARLGGDEFTILITEINEINLEIVENRIFQKLSRKIPISDYELDVTLSIGVSLFPRDGTTSDILVKNADIAMYNSKSNGKNKLSYFNQSMHDKLVKKIKLEHQLQKAYNNKEFKLYFQPIINVKSNKLSSIEILLRWQNPERGLMSPGDFIMAVEETGLIIPLGEWILRTACMQYNNWRNKGLPPVNLTVNLSVKQFHGKKIIKLIESIIKKNYIEPNKLGFEITEYHTMDNVENALNTMQAIKNIGAQLLMDDFGSGYSSFNWLKKFPIDKIKIDQSFIRNLTNAEKDATIIKTIINLAHGLKITAIAEGVETLEQYEFLKSNGCDEIQGFFYYKPLSTNDFENTFLKGNNNYI